MKYEKDHKRNVRYENFILQNRDVIGSVQLSLSQTESTNIIKEMDELCQICLKILTKLH